MEVGLHGSRAREEEADAWVAKLKAMVSATRSLRGEMNLSPAMRVPLNAIGDAQFMAEAAPVLQTLAKLSEVKLLLDEANFAEAARQSPVAVVGEARLALFVEIDVEAERSRLERSNGWDRPIAAEAARAFSAAGQTIESAAANSS